MIRKTLIAAAVLGFLATPALASHCPKDAAAIDHALSILKVSDKVKTDVNALRDKGMAEHKAGKHGDAETTLAEAMRMLLNAVK